MARTPARLGTYRDNPSGMRTAAAAINRRLFTIVLGVLETRDLSEVLQQRMLPLLDFSYEHSPGPPPSPPRPPV